MRAPRRLVRIGIAVALLCAEASATHAAMIVVDNDEWTLSAQAFVTDSSNTTNFVGNILNQFNGGQPGNYLAYSINLSLTGGCCIGGSGASGTYLRDTVVGAGNTWTVDHTHPVSLSYFAQFDGVFLTSEDFRSDRGFPDVSGLDQALTDYVNQGGNVYVASTGDPVESALANGFLNNFGLGFSPVGFNGLCCDVAIPDFPDPLFDDVQSLYFNNGDWVTETAPANPAARLFMLGGNGLFGIYRVPEPGTLTLLGIGLASISRRRRRAKFHPLAKARAPVV